MSGSATTNTTTSGAPTVPATGGSTTTSGLNPFGQQIFVGTPTDPGIVTRAWDLSTREFVQPDGTTSTIPIYSGDLYTGATDAQIAAWAEAAGMSVPDYSNLISGIYGAEGNDDIVDRLRNLGFTATSYDSGYEAPTYDAPTVDTDVSFSDVDGYEAGDLTASYTRPTDYVAGTFAAPQVSVGSVSSNYQGTGPYTPGQIAANFQAPAAYNPTQFESTFKAPANYTPADYQTEYVAPEEYEAGKFDKEYFDKDSALGYTERDYTDLIDFERPENLYKAGESPDFERFDAQWRDFYMSPYFEAALEPQLREAQRSAQIQRLQDAGRLTKAGAFGGSRQAIMESELNRNLMTNLSDIRAKGYQTAFEQARDQFTKDESRKLDTYKTAEQAKQAESEIGLKAAELDAMYASKGAELTENSRQFLAKNRMEAADLAAKYGLDADKANELSRQFAYGKQMDAAEFKAKFGLDKEQAEELSKQFAAGQKMKAAELSAQFDLEADKATELSKQFAAGQMMTAADLKAKYGLEESKAQELARQFGAELASKEAYNAAQLSIEAQKATLEGNVAAAKINVEAAMDAMRLAENSRQFSSTFSQDVAKFAADYGLRTYEAEELAKLNENKQKITVEELQAKYGLAKDEAERLSAEFEAKFEADVEETSARLGLDAQRYEDLSNQFAAQFGLDNLKQQLEAYSEAGKLEALETDAGIATLKLQLAAGAEERAVEKEEDVANFTEWMRQLNYPQEQVEFMRDIISGLPVSTTTVAPAQASLMGDILGMVGGIGSLLTYMESDGGKWMRDLVTGALSGMFGSGSGSGSGSSSGSSSDTDAAIADGAVVMGGPTGTTPVI